MPEKYWKPDAKEQLEKQQQPRGQIILDYSGLYTNPEDKIRPIARKGDDNDAMKRRLATRDE